MWSRAGRGARDNKRPPPSTPRFERAIDLGLGERPRLAGWHNRAAAHTRGDGGGGEEGVHAATADAARESGGPDQLDVLALHVGRDRAPEAPALRRRVFCAAEPGRLVP